MTEKYIQTQGNSKGNIVEIVRPEGYYIRLLSIKYNAQYLVAKTDFEKYYKLIVRQPLKIKRETLKK